MPKFMYQNRLTQSGLQGIIKEGFAKREPYIRQLFESLGGKVEAFYWAYGEDDVVAIVDLPDAAAAVALSLAVNASGALQVRTTPLLTAADMDAAVAKMPQFRPPGQ